jgi:hypothetical protein
MESYQYIIEEVSFDLQISAKTLSQYVNTFRRMGNVNTGVNSLLFACVPQDVAATC